MTGKKILIFANEDKGLYTFRGMLIKKLQQQGNVVTVCVPEGKNPELLVKLGVKIIFTPIDRRGMNPFKDFKLYCDYKKIIKKEQPDYIITYTVKCNIYGGLAAHKARVKFYMNIAGLGTSFQKDNLLKRIVVFLYKKPAMRAEKVFFENESNRDIFIKATKIAAEKTVVLPGAGVDLQEYEKIPLPEGEPITFLFLARIMKEKGFEELAEAFGMLKKEFGDKVSLIILGGMEDDYVSCVKQLESDGIMKYYGLQKDVKPFIAKSHCCVLPSYHEGMSNALLECAAMGRALITSNIPGCREAVEENVNGWLVPVQNTEALYEAMKKFVNLSGEQRAVMGEKSRLRMESSFDKRKVVEITLSYFD